MRVWTGCVPLVMAQVRGWRGVGSSAAWGQQGLLADDTVRREPGCPVPFRLLSRSGGCGLRGHWVLSWSLTDEQVAVGVGCSGPDP